MDIDIGARLKAVRQARKLSQRELARRAGLTNATVSLIESNQMNPSVGALKRVLDGIPMSLAEFFAQDIATPRQAFYTAAERSEEHTSELQSLMRISYAVFCLKKKNTTTLPNTAPTKTYQLNLNHDQHLR